MKAITNDVVTTALKIIDTMIDTGLMREKWTYDYLSKSMPASLGITKFDNGATKWVVMPESLDGWVIKFSNSAYCKREAENYGKAVMAGYESYFPSTCLLKEVGGWSFILAEKCYGGRDDATDYIVDTLMDSGCWDKREDAYDYVDSGEVEDNEIVDILIGDSVFIHWLEENEIDDLHLGNFLKNECGDWVVIDFSGYNINLEEDEEYDD